MTDRRSAAVRLEGINKTFGSFVALKSIDLTIEPGELVCFLGPSGCGKTTLLRIIAGLEQQTSGRILQNGVDVSNAPPAARDYGIVFQSYALFPNLTIAENVGYGLVNRRKGRAELTARVSELLSLVGLAGCRREVSEPDVGRPAAARRARACAGDVAEPAAARRAVVRARREGARAAARRDPAAAAAAARDDDHGDARPGRGAVDGRPRRRDERRRDRAGRHGQRGLRAAATPFVADFLGKVNVLKATSLGGGRYRVGSVDLTLPACNAAMRPAKSVRIYMRPEDRHVEGDIASLPNRLRGRIAHIDYLGTFCLAELRSEALGQPMLISYSLNQMHDLGVREGVEVDIALRVDRVRVFRATTLARRAQP